MSDLVKNLHPATVFTRPEPPASVSEPLSPPISLASAWRFRDIYSLADVSSGRRPGWFYRRYGHPASRLLEEHVAKLEGAEDSVALATGMAACVSIFWALFRRGDHVIASEDLYGGSYAFFTGPLAKIGVRVSLVEASEQVVRRAIRPRTRAIFLETITNPLMKVPDLPALAALARDRKLLTIVDGTFATPYHCRPVALGADLVYHSATKFLGGHGDALGGIVAGKGDLISAVRKLAIGTGGTISPLDAWLILRGIKTLHLRMKAASEHALSLARYLSRHRSVRAVHYPGLGRIPRGVLTNGSGAMLSFQIKGDAGKFVRALGLVELVPSLGDVSTTVAHPWTSSHSYLPEAERLRLGVTPSLVRVSAGIDDPRDIQEDFNQALRRS